MKTYLQVIFLIFMSFDLLQASPKHVGPSYDSKPRNALDVYAEALAKQNKMKLLLSGLGITASEGGLWGLHFISSEKMTIEQARPYATQISNKLVGYVYSNPLFSEYFLHNRNPRRLLLKDISYQIAFWDEEMNRPLFPYLAQISFCNGKLYYYYASPRDQSLTEPIIETIIEK